MGAMQGLGMPLLETMQQQQAQAPQQPQPTERGVDTLSQPQTYGDYLMRHMIGLTETPTEKQAQAIQLEEKKKQLESQYAPEVARGKKMAELSAKYYDDALQGIQGAQNIGQNIDLVLDALNRNQNLLNIAGPMQSVLTKWVGSDNDRETLGQVDSLLGNIVLDAAKSIFCPIF